MMKPNPTANKDNSEYHKYAHMRISQKSNIQIQNSHQPFR
jgi:hypothetical protein